MKIFNLYGNIGHIDISFNLFDRVACWIAALSLIAPGDRLLDHVVCSFNPYKAAKQPIQQAKRSPSLHATSANIFSLKRK
jgi:hypothetical protein